VIRPYARRGLIDHPILSHAASTRPIEDHLLDGQRLDPATAGGRTPDPTSQQDSQLLGNLLADFNFNQRLRPPELLPLHPPSGPASPAP
jgi:hypothetical protein